MPVMRFFSTSMFFYIETALNSRAECNEFADLLFWRLSLCLWGTPGTIGVQIKMRDCMDRRLTPTKRVTSPTWGPPPPCKQALCPVTLTHFSNHSLNPLLTMFKPLIHSAPFLRFSLMLLYTNFFICILPREVLFLSLMMLFIGESSELCFILNFSSQKPQLNYILISKVYSFDTMEFPFSNSLIIH